MKKYAYIGSLGFIGVITTEFGVIGILPQIATHYGITIDKAGWLLSAFALAIAVTGPFMTLITSSYNRKTMMTIALALFVITGVVSFLSPPFWLLMLVRILPAFLQPVYIASALSVAINGADKSRENELMSIVFAGVAIAMVTTVPFATWLASLHNWQYSFLVQLIVSIIAVLAIYFGLPSMPVAEPKSFGSQLRILRDPVFIISALVNLCMVSGWFSTYSYFVDYLNKAKQMDDTMVSYMMFLFGIIGVGAMWVAGKLLNKHIAGTTMFFLSGTLIVPLLLHLAGVNLMANILVIGLWGFLYSPSFLNASTYMISAAPGALEFANSLSTSFGNLGVTIGTTAGGWMIAHYGVGYTPWLTFAFGLLTFALMGLRKLLLQRKVQFALQ
ncbi:putative MFS family arabinose efflux permease [Chitinophaga dinghuensis]|uniref:Putative MFS family arabinose efflux permease n=1 Tax=Chitinophaga dinghuensis TaxID=1539050 RepID=A0A327VW92_9BACT|nr:MFS transporter [Chitinophaga dinghuensis]RAJ80209.1 putative MFS family arabinose efflux permease [Chitinophaga dinghuensis]